MSRTRSCIAFLRRQVSSFGCGVVLASCGTQVMLNRNMKIQQDWQLQSLIDLEFEMAVAKERAGGRWSEARYFSFIRSALRKASMRYPVKTDALIASRRPRTEASGEGKHTYEHQCATCEFWFQGKDVAVDHIVGAGSLKTFDDLAGFVERLFCELKGLQVLCKACHTIKTNHEKGKK